MMRFRDGFDISQVQDLGPDEMYMVRLNGPSGTFDGIIWRHVVMNSECLHVLPFDMLRKPNWQSAGEWPNITIKPAILCSIYAIVGNIVDGKWKSDDTHTAHGRSRNA